MRKSALRWRIEDAVQRLRAMADPEKAAGLARFGIRTNTALGVPVPKLRALAREIGKNRELADALWETGIHEARLLSSLVDDPQEVPGETLEKRVRGIDSWDVGDMFVNALVVRTGFAREKALLWAEREGAFEKRCGFVLMAALAVHDKASPDERFRVFLPVIRTHAADGRNFVKKAVNWALRQIGKRSRVLNTEAIIAAERIASDGGNVRRWVASNALRELRDPKVLARIRR